MTRTHDQFSGVTMEVSQGDDTIFLPMADFLTLLSITFIFVALQYGMSPSVGADPSVSVIKSARSSIPIRQLDDTVVYVGIIPRAGSILLRIVPPRSGVHLERDIGLTLSEPTEREILVWAQTHIRQVPGIKTVVIDLVSEGAPNSAYRLAVNFVSAFRLEYDVQFSP